MGNSKTWPSFSVDLPHARCDPSYWQGPLQNYSLPTYIRDAGYTTGIFGKELNANTETFVSPGWDRFFALGGNDEVRIAATFFSRLVTKTNFTAFLWLFNSLCIFSSNFCLRCRATTTPTGFAKTAPVSTSALTHT
jgi:hypothetical protein